MLVSMSSQCNISEYPLINPTVPEYLIKKLFTRWPSNLKLNGGEQQKDHEKMAIKEFVIDIMEFVKNRKYRNQGD